MVFNNMDIIKPVIDISSGTAKYIHDMPTFEVGHNYSDECCNIDSSNDWEAILEFLNEYKNSEKTFRSYTTELERLSLWIIHEHKVPLSGLKRSDLSKYYEFLSVPPKYWAGPSSKKFKTDGSINLDWRPFKISIDGKHGLADSTISRIQKILQSLFNYLVDEGYLLGNPAITRRTKGQRATKTSKQIERFLQPHEVLFVKSLLCDLVDEAKKVENKPFYFKALRRYYIFELFLHTGMRISEPVKYTMGDISIKGTGNKKDFSIDIQGKGNIDGEYRTVVLGENFIPILKDYREALNDAVSHKNWKELDPLPSFNESTPIIPDFTGLKPIGERQISTLFTEIRDIGMSALDLIIQEFVGEKEEQNDLKRMKSTLKKFTCHWMRHTHATYFLAQSGDLKATQERLGHSDLSTTQIYIHVLGKTKTETANKFDPSKLQELI
jgi:integrase/recombinase XerD